MAQYKIKRRTRYHNIRSYGFLPFEARELSKVRDTSAGYFRQMLSDRKEAIEQVKRGSEYEGLSLRQTLKEIVSYIKYDYQDRGVDFNEGGLWDIYRQYRDDALDRGEYYPKRRKRKQFSFDGRRIDRGRLKEQRQRYHDKLKKRGY